MPKIVLSDDAPEGDLRFSLGNEEIDEVPYETNDPTVLANAEVHPWLAVEREEVEELSELAAQHLQVAPEDDVLSAQNSIANDPDEVRKALAKDHESDPVAIESGLDQGDVVETDSGVAETVAAANQAGDDYYATKEDE